MCVQNDVFFGHLFSFSQGFSHLLVVPRVGTLFLVDIRNYIFHADHMECILGRRILNCILIDVRLRWESNFGSAICSSAAREACSKSY